MSSRRTHSLGITRARSRFAYAPRLNAMEDRMSPGDTGFGMSLAWGFLDSPIVNPIASLEAPALVSRVSTDHDGATAASVQGADLAQLPTEPLVVNGANGYSGDLSLTLENAVLHGPNNGRAVTPSINEIRRDQPSTDTDEYFELAGDPGGDLSPYTYIVLGDDGANTSGVIESVISLAGFSFPGTGFFVGAEPTFTLGTANLTQLELNFENTDNVTHMLVSGFTGALNDDIDADNDGVLETTPWTSITDCIAIVGPGTGDPIHCAQKIGPEGPFHPGHVYDCLNANGWTWGAFGGGDDTVGAANVPGRCYSGKVVATSTTV